MTSLFRVGYAVQPYQCVATGAVDVTVGFETPTTIQVIEASYGNSCGNATGNVTRIVAQQCNGKTTCSVWVANETLGGDPFPWCPKGFEVVWMCGSGQRTARHSPAYAENYPVDLTCQ